MCSHPTDLNLGSGLPSFRQHRDLHLDVYMAFSGVALPFSADRGSRLSDFFERGRYALERIRLPSCKGDSECGKDRELGI